MATDYQDEKFKKEVEKQRTALAKPPIQYGGTDPTTKLPVPSFPMNQLASAPERGGQVAPPVMSDYQVPKGTSTTVTRLREPLPTGMINNPLAAIPKNLPEGQPFRPSPNLSVRIVDDPAPLAGKLEYPSFAGELASTVGRAGSWLANRDAFEDAKAIPEAARKAEEEALSGASPKPEQKPQQEGSPAEGQVSAPPSQDMASATPSATSSASNSMTMGGATYAFNPETGGFDRQGAAPTLTAGDMAARARILSQTPVLGAGTNLGQLPRAAAATDRAPTGPQLFGGTQTGRSFQDVATERGQKDFEQSTLRTALQDAVRNGNTRLAQAISTRLGQTEQNEVTARGQDAQLEGVRAQAEATALGRMPQPINPAQMAEAQKTQYELQRQQRIDELVNVAQTKAGTPEGEAASRMLQAFQQQDNPRDQQWLSVDTEAGKATINPLTRQAITPEMMKPVPFVVDGVTYYRIPATGQVFQGEQPPPPQQGWGDWFKGVNPQ